MKIILEQLNELKDEKYAQFQANLTPGIEASKFIGVRTPDMKKLAQKVASEEYCEAFLDELPHRFFDENQLHGFVISEIKDFDECIKQVERFLPYIDNWATCDQTAPKIFKKNKDRLMPYIEKWLASGETYTIRFAINMLMKLFLDEAFDDKYLDMVALIRSEEYYVRMEIAWYMATALAKQWETTIPYLENYKMESWTHNKTIQKARESYRISDNQKEYLKTLKVR